MRGLYAIVDASVTPRHQLADLAKKVIEGGAVLVQYRDKTATADQLRCTAAKILPVCQAANVPLLLNDHPKCCLELGADGVHLGRDDMSVAEARALFGPSKIIGATCYNNIAVARKAEHDGASYVAFGAIYSSSTKPSAPPARLQTLNDAKQSIRIPLVAIGGITPDNGAAVVTAGADMIAAISGLSNEHPAQSAQLYSNLFKAK
jgi:thiamine-phosphate pyrophosphorylase